MLAIDVPTAAFAAMLLTGGGKKMLRDGDPKQTTFMRLVVLLYTAIFYTPVPLIFLNGWPAWQTNYILPWADNLMDSPIRACVTLLFYALTVIPALLSFELGRLFIRKKKESLVWLAAVVLFLVIFLLIYLTRDISFNVASTYAKYHAKEFFPALSGSFARLLLITSIYTWGGLAIVIAWIRKKG